GLVTHLGSRSAFLLVRGADAVNSPLRQSSRDLLDSPNMVAPGAGDFRREPRLEFRSSDRPKADATAQLLLEEARDPTHRELPTDHTLHEGDGFGESSRSLRSESPQPEWQEDLKSPPGARPRRHFARIAPSR